jgi:hypothetical protein
VDLLSVKLLLHQLAETPEAVSIQELDEAITWLLAREKRRPEFAGAARQMEKLRQHLCAGEFRQARNRARLAIGFFAWRVRGI